MMILNRLELVAIGLCVLGACTSPPSEPTDAERGAALRDSAFGGLVDPLDRAAEVQQLQNDRKRELDAAIEE